MNIDFELYWIFWIADKEFNYVTFTPIGKVNNVFIKFAFELDNWQTLFQVIPSLVHVFFIVATEELTKKQLFESTPCWNMFQSTILAVHVQGIKSDMSIVLKKNHRDPNLIRILVFWTEEIVHYKNEGHSFFWLEVPTSKTRFDWIISSSCSRYQLGLEQTFRVSGPTPPPPREPKNATHAFLIGWHALASAQAEPGM